MLLRSATPKNARLLIKANNVSQLLHLRGGRRRLLTVEVGYLRRGELLALFGSLPEPTHGALYRNFNGRQI